MVDKLNQSKLNEKEFEKEVIEKYINQEITASEVSNLERYKKASYNFDYTRNKT